MSFLIANFYFFYFAVIGVYVIFIPKVLSMVEYTPSQIGIILSLAPLVRFILPFFFLRGLQLSKQLFNYSLILMLFSSFLFYIELHNFYGLLVSSALLGIGTSLTLPYIEVVALEHIGHERYGKLRLFGSLGFIVVALVLVKFLSSADVAMYYLIATVFITLIFGVCITKNEKDSATSIEEKGMLDFKSHWSLWLGLMFMQISFGAFYNFFTIYETAHKISLDMTIYLWSFGVIVEVFMLYFQAPLLRKNLLLILQLTTLLTAFRWLILYLFPENIVLLFFSQSLHAFSYALFHSAAISYLYYLYVQKKLAQQFFSGITYGVGGLIGALGAGYIYEYMPDELFLVAALMAFIATLAIHHSYTKTRSQTQ